MFKWFTKCLTLRLEPVADRIIHKAQSAFIKGRNIMNSVLALHEIMHETKKKENVGVMLKLDFEKAYDKVHWRFLMRYLQKAGFYEIWCNWIKKVMEQGNVAVKMNNIVGIYFMSYKGVRQGDSLSPLLFNFAADVLSRMVNVAQENLLVTGLAGNLIDHGIAILQYADDTVMCIEDNMDKARNVKLMIYLFEQMSSLKINFDKSEIILIGGDNSLAVQYVELFNCQVGLFPMKYLGVPIAPGILHVVDWARLEEKYGKKLDIWQGGLYLWLGEQLLSMLAL
jgi:hypothetical protein